MPQLQLLDEETGDTYIFTLTKHQFVRASTDLAYSTQLLAKAKNSEVYPNVEENHNTEENYKVEENHNVEENYNVEEETYAREIYNSGFRWENEAIRLLLAAYRQHENLFRTGKVSVKKFWEIISQILKEKSYNITGLQCKSKFHGLKKTYKNIIKEHNNKNGNNRRIWPYFEIMDEIFRYKSWMIPIFTLDTSDNISPPISPSSSNNSLVPRASSPSVSCTFERPRKRQKVTQQTILEKFLAIVQEDMEEKRNMLKKREIERKKMHEERKTMHEDAMARLDRLLALLEKIANKE